MPWGFLARFNEAEDRQMIVNEDETAGATPSMTDAAIVVVGTRQAQTHVSSISTGSIGDQRHCHSSLYPQLPNNEAAEKSLMMVTVLSFFFIIIEFSGGLLAHSLALMTDAGHLFSDLLTFVISIVALRMAREKANQKRTFGFYRAEVLGAMISIAIIWMLTVVLVMLAIQRIIDNDLDVDANTMIVTATAGVIFNIIMGCVLHCTQNHSHGFSHNHRQPVSRDVNIRAAFIHIIGDFVQSLGVLTAAIIIKLTDWKMADPFCTFLFSVVVLSTSFTIIRDISNIIMEGTPTHFNYVNLQSDLLRIDDVKMLHNLNVWSLNANVTVVNVHLVIDAGGDAVKTMNTANHLIRFKYGAQMVTVQVEAFDASMLACDHCHMLY